MPAPQVIGDRVSDTTTTTGTGDLTLSGTAPTGYQTFANGVGVGPATYYTISTSGGSEWEVGSGHLSASTTFVRDIVYSSSNSGALVNLSSGTKTIFGDCPAWLIGQLQPQSTMNQVARGNFLP